MKVNANQKPTFGDLSNLDNEKLQQLDTVLTSILASPIARDTYAQIIDGRPTRTPHSDDIKAQKSHLLETIIVSDNATPSDHAIREYEKMRAGFALAVLSIDFKLAQDYQNAPPGSREHQLRLLEIVAASLHALAGIMYASFHPHTEFKPSEPPEGHWWQFRNTDHFYVDFYHTRYQQFVRYPFGLLNVVGYWVEAELLGGVMLFERGESDSDQIVNAFVHPQKATHAFQLCESQLISFMNLGTPGVAAGGPGAQSLLPFVKEPLARTEPTYVRRGEGPLRIYKNDYDKQPIAHFTEEGRCIITEDDPRAVSMEKIRKLMVEKGLGHRAPTAPLMAPLSEPSSRKSPLPPHGAASSSKAKPPPPANEEGQ